MRSNAMAADGRAESVHIDAAEGQGTWREVKTFEGKWRTVRRGYSWLDSTAGWLIASQSPMTFPRAGY